jgi:diacylglycerol kinase (ATP)
MKRSRSGVKRLFDAAGHSLRGIRAAWQHEAAFRQTILLAVVLFALSFALARSVEQWLLLNLPLILLLIVELLNSAIENVVDRIGLELHQLSGRAKDMAAASVLFCHVLIATAWITITWVNLL